MRACWRSWKTTTITQPKIWLSKITTANTRSTERRLSSNPRVEKKGLNGLCTAETREPLVFDLPRLQSRARRWFIQLRQNHQFGLAAAAHSIGCAGIEGAGVVLVAARSARLGRDRLVGSADDRIVRIKRGGRPKRDHEYRVLVRTHP